MGDKSLVSAKGPDLRFSHQAMRRAALKAREIAAQTGTAIVITEQGVMREVHPSADQVTPSVQESKGVYNDKS